MGTSSSSDAPLLIRDPRTQSTSRSYHPQDHGRTDKHRQFDRAIPCSRTTMRAGAVKYVTANSDVTEPRVSSTPMTAKCDVGTRRCAASISWPHLTNRQFVDKATRQFVDQATSYMYPWLDKATLYTYTYTHTYKGWRSSVFTGETGCLTVRGPKGKKTGIECNLTFPWVRCRGSRRGRRTRTTKD
jgi:hypothetical protein